jgi:hypothetical protein
MGVIENIDWTDGQLAINHQIDVREAEKECPYDGLPSVGDHESTACLYEHSPTPSQTSIWPSSRYSQ